MAATKTAQAKAGRRRTVAQQVKDAQAAEWHLLGYQLREIVDEFGYRSPSSAHDAVQRGLADKGAFRLTREEIRVWVMESLHLLVRKQYEIAEAPHYVSAPSGSLVSMYDEAQGKDVYVPDDGPKHRALAEIRQLVTQIAMLGDIKPPSRSRVETITRDVIEEKIEELEADLGRNDPGTRRGSA